MKNRRNLLADNFEKLFNKVKKRNWEFKQFGLKKWKSSFEDIGIMNKYLVRN